MDYIANLILKKLCEKLEYRPIDIQADVKRELGAEITYSAALGIFIIKSTQRIALHVNL